MSRNRQRLINFHGSAGLPSPYDMAYGEIAVVHDPLDPKLAIRVSEMELRIFRSYEGKVIKTEDAFTALTSADTDYLVDAAFLKDYITTDEEVIASALNDLNDRLVAAENTIGDLDTSIEEGLESLDERMEAVEEQLENISELLPEMVVTEEEFREITDADSGKTVAASLLAKIILDDEEITAAALTDIDYRLKNIENGDSMEIITDEETFAALTSADTGYVADAAMLSKIISDDEFVISTALNDHEERIVELEGRIEDVATGDFMTEEDVRALIQTGDILTDTKDTAGQQVNNTVTTYPIVANNTTTTAYGQTYKVTSVSFNNGVVSATGFKENGTNLTDKYQAKGGYLSASTKYAASSSVGGAATNSMALNGYTYDQFSLATHNHDTVYAKLATTYTKAEVDALISGIETSIDFDDIPGLAEALAGKSDTGHTHDDRYYTEAEINTLLAGKSNTGHSHNDLYYTETEVNNLLAGKSDTGHTHTKSEITDFAHTHGPGDITGNTTYAHNILWLNNSGVAEWTSASNITAGNASELGGVPATEYVTYDAVLDGGTF